MDTMATGATETTATVTATELRQRLAARGMSVLELAGTAGVWPSDMYKILNGRQRASSRNRARIEQAIVELKLDQEPDLAPAQPEPVFRIRRL